MNHERSKILDKILTIILMISLLAFSISDQIDLKRAEFRHYLEKSGVMDTLSRALIKLYDEQPKPDDPVAFVRRHFVNVDDPPNANGPEIITTDAGDSDPLFGNKKCADALIESLREELTKAGQEIAVLQKALDTMQTSTE